MEAMFEVLKWKLSFVVSTTFICTPQDATLLEMEQKRGGGGGHFELSR